MAHPHHNQHIKKIIFISVLVLSFSCVYNIRNERWHTLTHWLNENPNFNTIDTVKEEKIKNSYDYDCNPNVEEDCDNSKEIFETNDVSLKRRSNFPVLNNLDKLLDGGKSEDTIPPYFHTIQPFTCSCMSYQYNRDLGYGYYPRYLTTAVCNSDKCGIYRCRQRLYEVHVLKRLDDSNTRESNTQITNNHNNVPLPESLRKNWVFEKFTITVACECGP